MMQLIKVKEGRLHTKSSHGVGVTVAAGPPLLQVAVALGRHVPGYPDAGATVVHASRELVHRAGLVQAGQAPAVVLSSVTVVFNNYAAKRETLKLFLVND